MAERVLFPKGEQRKFFKKAVFNLNAPSLRAVLAFLSDITYSTFKKYYQERLLLPRDLFESLCRIAKIDEELLEFRYVRDNWGQIKGGKKGIRTLQRKYPEKIKEWRKFKRRKLALA